MWGCGEDVEQHTLLYSSFSMGSRRPSVMNRVLLGLMMSILIGVMLDVS